MDTPTPNADEPAPSRARRIRKIAGGVAAIAVSCVLVMVLVNALDPEPPKKAPPASPFTTTRPSRPPGPDDPKPAPPPLPKLPALSAREKVQLAEQVRGSKQPGRDAFRAVSDRYVEENLDLAKRQAAAESLSMQELREVTYFGLLVLATQRFEEVEALTGRPLTEAQRDQLAKLMQTENAGFTKAMRELVARGGSEAERWKLIRDTEARYTGELYRISGLDDLLLDDLLAGNIALPGAPAQGVPEGPRIGGPRDDGTTPPRPSRP